MNGISDPSSIIGVKSLIHLEDGDALDIEELEREISGNVRKETPQEMFKSELDNINNELDNRPRRNITEIKYPPPRSLMDFTSDALRQDKPTRSHENLFMETAFPLPTRVK